MIRGNLRAVYVQRDHYSANDASIGFSKFNILPDAKVSMRKSGNEWEFLRTDAEYVLNVKLTQFAHFPPLAISFDVNTGWGTVRLTGSVGTSGLSAGQTMNCSPADLYVP